MNATSGKETRRADGRHWRWAPGTAAGALALGVGLKLLSLLPGVAYAARGAVAEPGLIGKVKAMIRRAFSQKPSM